MDPGKRTFYLGRYNCIEQLGTGPIGETYRAKIYGVAGFEKQFAVKRLHPHLSEDEAFVGRFVQAASAFAALEHPGIARVHEVNAQGAHYYLVVDLVRGIDLRRLLDLLQQRGEALSADAAMAIAMDVADALAHAHGRTNLLPGGVLHLGLTAPSVMLTYEGEVKLVDVGLMAALVRPGWATTDDLTPTLAYLAPETWRGEAVDARADVFSLGVVLHEMLGGARVFFSDRADELRRAIDTGPPPPPPADPRLQEVVTRALQPFPNQRFGGMEEMRAAVAAILGGRVERARSDLSALVRRLALPREKRTGAFAAVVLPPAATGATTPLGGAKPPPIPASAAARPWAPPMPKPPVGPVLSAPPHYNTLAGIGPDDQALVPIELVELPGKPTEKALPTVHPDDAETNRFTRSDARELATTPSDLITVRTPMPTPAELEDARAVESSDLTPVPPPAPPLSDSADVPDSLELPQEPRVTNGEAALPASAPEPSWLPPPLPPSPPPSPVPVFAPPAEDRPEPVEKPRTTVPAAKLPPRAGTSWAVLAIVGLLAVAGGVAIWAGLGSGSGQRTPPEPSQPTQATQQQRATEPTVAAADSRPDLAESAQRAIAPAAARDLAVAAAAAPSAPVAPPRGGEGYELVTTPAGATVYVDGEAQGTTPAQLTVPAGPHKLVVAAEGQKLVKRQINIAPGGKLELTLEPARLPAGVAGDQGLKVRCHTQGELRVYVDGADSGRSCPNDQRISVTAGPHKIGLYSPRTDEMHEVEHEIAEGNNSTRVYVKY